MYERSYGRNYDGDRDVKDDAKLIRKEIKDLQRRDGAGPDGLPADLKVGVRIRRFSGGQSIDITVRECSFVIERPKSTGPERLERYTDEAQRVVKILNGILASYNHDGSDTMSDYFDVKFYGHATFDWRLVTRQTEAA